jgi:hypothetical protein
VAGAIATGSRNAAYELTPEDLRTFSIDRLPAEKQAVVVENYYADEALRNDENYKRFIAQVRRARPLPESIILEDAAFGPGGGRRNMFEDPSLPGDRLPGTVPLLRLEF